MALAVSPQQWAHRGGRHTGRLKRSSGLETVRGHHLGSPACKPLAGSPILLSGRRTAPRSTTSATDRSRPCCAAWCSSTPPPSSKRSNRQPAPACCRFVKDEFDAFLEYGILAHGFLRLHCGDCGHDKMVAVSCKRRGFCPSCGARRAARGKWRRRGRTWSTTSFRTCRAPVGSVASHPAAPVAGRATRAGDAGAAGGAPPHHAPLARASRSEG